MAAWMRLERTLRARFAIAVVIGSLVGTLLPVASALAAVSVTSATGGGAISADAAATGGSGAYTTLIGPVITEGVPGDIANGTIVITVPAGFEFQASSGTAVDTPAGCELTLSAVTVTTATATVTVSGAPSTVECSITFSSLRVRPTAGTPLASAELAVSGTAGVSDGTAGVLTEVPGAPVLTFTDQPASTVVAGESLGSIVVHDQDQFGNFRGPGSFSDTITLAIKSGTGTAGATLTCTDNTVDTDASGDASFAACSINKSGTGYRLRATSDAGGTAVDSDTITVNPGTGVKLGFVTQPERGRPGSDFAQQPAVAIQDALDNTVTSSATTVTLAIGTNPGPGTLSCTNGLSKGTSGGVAIFSGCEITNLGVGYTLTASAPGLTSATSELFDVADRLAFTTQPAGAVGGVAFTTQPVVTVRSGTTNTATHDQDTPVTLAIGSGPTGAVLTCTTNPVTAVNGVATFAGCKLDKVGTYTLTATGGSLNGATSASFSVVAVSLKKIGFNTQPSGAVVNQAFTGQPVVAIQDAGGNTVTTGAFATATVTLAIGTNPGGGTLSCTGGNSKAAVAGIATFAGCKIDRSGTGYTLTASASGLTSATSNAFNVTVPAAEISLSSTASVIIWGNGVTLNVHFGGVGASRTFALQSSRDQINWATIATLTTDTAGNAFLAYRPVTNLFYRASFAGATDLAANNSNTVRVVVRQKVLLRPTNSGAVKAIRRGTSITFTTTVRPARPELAPARVTFAFYRRVAGVWVFFAKRDVYIDALGKASWTWRFSTVGEWYVRSRANPTLLNANSFWSPLERYSVR